MIWNWSVVLFFPLSAVIHATGNVKRISLLNGTIYLLVVPITYVLFKFTDCSPLVPFILNAFLGLLGCFINLQTVKMYVKEFRAIHYLTHSTLRGVLAAIVGSIVPYIVSNIMNNDWKEFLLVCVLCLMTNTLSMLFIGMNSTERASVKKMVFSKLHINK